jgi:glycosyltransferase involved in cell wall biosynthesis
MNGPIVHLCHYPVSARSFIAPLVAGLRAAGLPAELWAEDRREPHPALAEITVPLRRIDSDLTPRPWRALRTLLGLYRAFVAARPEVVHAHQTRGALLPLLAARLARVPVRVYHNHGLPYLGYGNADVLRIALRALERLNCALATQVVLVSRSNLAEAERDGVVFPGRARVLGSGTICGVDLERFAPPSPAARAAARQRLGISGEGFVLGWVGRPVRRKGFHLVLEAWERSGLGLQGGALVAAGCAQAECDAALGRAVAGVRGAGYVADMPGLYAACDAVALVSDHEGFPYALLEASAMGLPLIGSDIPGVRDAVIAGETGLLVAREPVAVAAAMRTLSADAALRGSLGACGRRRAERLFDRRRVVGALVDYYRDELGAGRAG